MTATNTAPTTVPAFEPALLRGLAACWAHSFLTGYRPLVNENALGMPRNKNQKAAVLRRLVAAGYATRDKAGQAYLATSQAYDEVTPVPADLAGLWEGQSSRGHWNERDMRPFVALGSAFWELDHDWSKGPNADLLGRLKSVLDGAEGPCQFYLIDGWYVVNDGVSDEMWASKLKGPFSLGDKLRAAYNAEDKNRSPAIIISTPALAELAARSRAKRRVDDLYPKLLPWALKQHGLVDEEKEADKVADLLDGDTHGLFSGGKPKMDPATWGEAHEKAVDALVAQMGELQGRLALLLKVGRRVDKFGGWEHLRASYRQHLEAAVNAQESGKEDTADKGD